MKIGQFKIKIKDAKGSDILIDLQEVKTKLENLDNKLKQIGDSL